MLLPRSGKHALSVDAIDFLDNISCQGKPLHRFVQLGHRDCFVRVKVLPVREPFCSCLPMQNIGAIVRTDSGIGPVKNSVLILVQKRDNFGAVSLRLVLQLSNPRGRIHNRVGKTIQKLGKLIDAPLDTGKVRPTKGRLGFLASIRSRASICSWYEGISGCRFIWY